MIKPPVVALGDVAALNPKIGENLPRPNELVDFLPMAGIDADASVAIPGEAYPYFEVQKGYTNFVDGDVLVAKITPCFENGKIAQVKLSRKLGFGSTEFHVIRPDVQKLDARYLAHFLRRKQVLLEGEKRMTGSAGQRRVPRTFLESLPIRIPSLAEQRRIAAILDKADELRTKRKEALALLDSMAQSIFVDMFGDPVKNSKKWQRVKFGALLENIDSGWSPVCLDRKPESSEWGVLKLGAISRCEFDGEESKALPPDILPDEKLEVKIGDLLFSRKNTYDLVAACALVHEAPPRLMMPDLMFRFKMKPDSNIKANYLHQLLVNGSKRNEIRKLASGSAGSMPNISKGRLLEAEIEVPPYPYQVIFDNCIVNIRNQVRIAKAAFEEMDRLFFSLQHRAFRGEL